VRGKPLRRGSDDQWRQRSDGRDDGEGIGRCCVSPWPTSAARPPGDC